MCAKQRQERNLMPVLAENPLEGEQLLLDAMYGEDKVRTLKRAAPPQAAKELKIVPPPPVLVSEPHPRTQAKPAHYKIVSISLYNEDIKNLSEMVRELKRRGHYKANKSQLIRYALSKVDLDEFPQEL